MRRLDHGASGEVAYGWSESANGQELPPFTNVVTGAPEEVAEVEGSSKGQFLREVLAEPAAAAA